MPVTHSRRLAAALTAASATLLMAACGGSDDAKTTTPAGNANGGGNGFAAYAECLRTNGVTLPSGFGNRGGRRSGAPGDRPSGFPSRPSGAPDRSGFPGGGGPGGGMRKPEGVDDATWQKAQQACSSLRPTGGPGGPGGGRGNGAGAAYRNCLNDHGIQPNQADATDAKTKEAVQACKVLSPTPSPPS